MPNLDWPSTPECQVVFEMFASPRGSVSLGRLNGGREVGRLVTLCEVPASGLAQARQAAATFGAVSQPKLLKVVGLVSDESRYYLAGEYIPGVSLYELIEAVRSRQAPLPTAIAVRIIIDALGLVATGRELLQNSGKPLMCLLHAECIWIAEFGETLLAGAGVAAYVASNVRANLDSIPDDDDRDTLPAALALFQLATGKLLVGDVCAGVRAHLKGPLSAVLENVFTGEYGGGPEAAVNFAEALARLPPELVGEEALVADELRPLVGELLEARKRRVAALKDGSNSPSVEDPTRVYSALLPDGGGPEEATVALRNQQPEPVRPAAHLELEWHAPRPASQFEALVPRRTKPPRSASVPSVPQRTAPVVPTRPKPTSSAGVARPRIGKILFLLLIVASGSAIVGFASPAWWRHLVSLASALIARL